MGIDSLSSVSSNVWNYVKAAGRAAKETVEEINVKDVAAYWTGKPAGDVTKGDIAKTFVGAALWPLAITGCSGNATPSIEDPQCPNSAKLTFISGFGEQTYNVLGGTTVEAVLKANIKFGPMEGCFSGAKITVGTDNGLGAMKVLGNDLASCDPAGGRVDGCSENSCRIVHSGAIPFPDIEGNSMIVPDTETSALASIWVDYMTDELAQQINFYGPRQLVVRSGGEKYLSADSLDVDLSKLGMVTDNVPFNFSGTHLLTTGIDVNDKGAKLAWVIDPYDGMCKPHLDADGDGKADLYKGSNGAQVLSWIEILRNFGRDPVTRAELPTPLPINVISAKVNSVKYGPRDISEVGGELLVDLYSDGEGKISFDVPKDLWANTGYFEGDLEIKVEIDARGAPSDLAKTIFTYFSANMDLLEE